MSGDLAALELAIGYRFKDPALLSLALTHSSYRGETGLERHPAHDNEQLEFLGDSVLGLLVSEHLVQSCPDFDEGRLSNIKAQLVNRSHLAAVAREFQIGSNLVLGKSEATAGGREKRSLLANAFEALIGAIYLDGGLDAARSFIVRHVVSDANLRVLSEADNQNVKSTLAALARSRNLPPPEYSSRLDSTGHPQIFLAEGRIGAGITASGRGTSKKAAESEAARVLLAKLTALESGQTPH